MGINKLIGLIADRNLLIALSLNPSPENLPPFVGTGTDGILKFNKLVVDALKDTAGAVCVDSDAYEEFGKDGMLVFAETLEYARESGLYSISEGTTLFKSDAAVVSPYGILSPEELIEKSNLTGRSFFLHINSFDTDVEIKMVKLISDYIYCTLAGEKYCNIGISVKPKVAEKVENIREIFDGCFFLADPPTKEFYTEAVRCCFKRDASGAIIKTDERFFAKCSETESPDELADMLRRRFGRWNRRAKKILTKNASLIR